MIAHTLATTCTRYITKLFHQRNIIIVSEHQVKQLRISGITQSILLAGIAGIVFWASYSTGKLAATQKQASVQPSVEQLVAKAATPAQPSDAKMDKTELLKRVNMLEQQVTKLEADKKNIIQRVSNKTAGQIDKLEHIIKQTGLNPIELRKIHKKQAALTPSMGGPYIPDDYHAASAPEKALYEQLDELTVLRQIIGNLPLTSPMKNGKIHSHFGRRIDPFNKKLAFHAGLDLVGPVGSRIYAASDGTISAAKRSSSYGYYVDIDHGYNLSTRYAHLSKLLVKPGQVVNQGDVIGIQGSTGRSTGHHLHYEVRYRAQALNPRKFLNAGRDVLEE